MPHPWLRTSTAALALCLLVSVSTSQDRRGQDKQDPQSSFEPRSGTVAAHRFLAQFAGEWDVVKTFTGRSGDSTRMTGTCTQTLEHGGRFLKSEFAFEQGGAKTTGTGLIGYEAPNGPFTSVWIDSRQTKMSARSGKGAFDGKEIVLFSKSLAEEKGQSRVSRTVTRLVDDTKKIVHRQYNVGPDGTERLLMELVLTRKQPASAPQK